MSDILRSRVEAEKRYQELTKRSEKANQERLETVTRELKTIEADLARAVAKKSERLAKLEKDKLAAMDLLSGNEDLVEIFLEGVSLVKERMDNDVSNLRWRRSELRKELLLPDEEVETVVHADQAETKK